MDDQLPTSAVDPLAAEAAVVAIGLKSILDAEPTWNAIQRHKAAQLPKAIRQFLVRFMTDADRPEPAELPAYKHDEIGKLLAEGPQEKQSLALARAVNNQALGLAIAAVATRIVHQLQPLFPRPNRVTNVAGLQSLPATPTTQRAFARVWAVACDPLIVLRDLLEGCLYPDQVRAFEMLFPNLYAMTLKLVDDVYADLKAKRPKFELTGRKDRQLGVLRGQTTATSNLPLAAEFQAVSQIQAPTPPPPAGAAATSPKLQTPGQAD